MSDDKCQAQTQTGGECGAPPLQGRDRCFQHCEAPEIVKQRQEARKKGGESSGLKPADEVPHDLDLTTAAGRFELLENAARQLLRKRPSIKMARALGYITKIAIANEAEEELDDEIRKLEKRIQEIEESGQDAWRGVA